MFNVDVVAFFVLKRPLQIVHNLVVQLLLFMGEFIVSVECNVEPNPDPIPIDEEARADSAWILDVPAGEPASASENEGDEDMIRKYGRQWGRISRVTQS